MPKIKPQTVVLQEFGHLYHFRHHKSWQKDYYEKKKLRSLSMNLQSVVSLNKLPLHILVERLDSGHFIASVTELADCVAEAENREDAISSMGYAYAFLQEKIQARLANIEILTIEVANNPWTDFIGMFEGDEDFAQLAEELRTERELDINGAA
jgi:predicted RNase H-like HicB family nuclease